MKKDNDQIKENLDVEKGKDVVEDTTIEVTEEKNQEELNTDVETSDIKNKKEKKNKLKEIYQKFLEKYRTDKNFRGYCVIGAFVFVLLLGILYFMPKESLNVFKKDFKIVNVEKQSTGTYANTDETFIIKTEGGSLEEVREHVYVEPAINYRIEQDGVNQYRLTTSDIPSDKLININYVDNQVVEDKWAFQSTKELKVNSVYPADGAKGVSVNTNIEVTFSYYDVESVKDYIEITPAVEGEYVHNGRTWSLRPSSPLQENTVYTIRIKEGLPYGKDHLTESVQTTFSTYQAANNKGNILGYDSITLDNIETFRPGEVPMFRSKTEKNISRVELLKVTSSDEFRKMLEKQEYAAESMGDIAFHLIEEEGNTSKNYLYAFDNPLEKGYYAVKAYTGDGELIFTMPMQIHELSAYLLNTQSDLLVWVGSNNTLLKDIPVTYDKKTITTDKEGLAIFKDYNSLEGNMKFITVGKDNPIFIGVNTQDNEMYANGYVYVDRPLYKNTDDIQIWGYIPFNFYQEWKDFSKDNFVLSFNDETIPIEISKNGIFKTSYHLENYKDGYYSLLLKYKNNTVATRGFQVLQYEKNNYLFNIKKDREYAFAGENFHFTVEVKHISGVYVPNKDISVTVGGEQYSAITDSNGVASFDIPAPSDQSPYGVSSYKSFVVKSALTDYAQQGIYSSFSIFNRFSEINDIKYDKDSKQVTFTAYNYPDTPVGRTTEDMRNARTPFSGNVQYYLQEEKVTRVQTGSHVNEFTKETIPDYTWYTSKSTVINNSVQVQDGKAAYNLDYDYKASESEDIRYNYILKNIITDRNGNTLEYTNYITPYVTGTTSASQAHYKGHIDYGSGGNSYCGGSGSSADLYSYYFAKDRDNRIYSVGENMTKDLYYYTDEKEGEGNPILVVKYKNHILNKEVYTYQDGLSIPFEDSDRPNIRMTAAYFKDGVFYRMPVETDSSKKEDNELTVDIQPDAKVYKPKDKVKVKVKVSKNGKGIKSTINVSVVDEGVFNDTQDYTPILSNIYTTKYYYQYTYSTYRDYTFYNNGGGCGGTSGGVRENFGDTIYFDSIETDKDGNATVEFTLNDSITSFRITVHAATDDADVGVNRTLIDSSLPISISFTEPRGIKVSDEVVLNAYSIGSSTEPVHYVFAIEGVDNTVEKDSMIGQTVFASFGQLPAGEYTATITATSGNESDKVKFPIRVVNSQTEVFVRNTFSIMDQSKIKPTKNPIILELYRETYRDYDTFLNIISDTKEERMDTRLSYTKALFYENRYLEEKNVVDLGDVSAFRGETGWKFLNAEDVSYPLTAIVSYYDKDLRFDKNIYYNMTKSENSKERINGYLVLSSMKEPVLDDVRYLFNSFGSNDDEVKEKLILAALFLGDYKTVRKYYTQLPDNNGLKTYLSTFVYKDNANQMIKDLHAADVANRYLYFSIVSYFENNHVDLDTKEQVTVSYGDKKEKVDLLPLGKKKLTIYQNDLKDLNISSKYSDIYYNYYYEGSFDEIDDALKDQSIGIWFENDTVSVGDSITMNINVSNVPRGTTLKVYLPNGLRATSGSIGKGAYISSNKIEYLTIYVGRDSDNELHVPLYASCVGNYVVEPIVAKKEDGRYLMSNSLNIHIQ